MDELGRLADDDDKPRSAASSIGGKPAGGRRKSACQVSPRPASRSSRDLTRGRGPTTGGGAGWREFRFFAIELLQEPWE